MLRLGLLLLVIPSVALMTAYMLEQNQIADCLADSGVWNYAEGQCETSGSFPFVPFMMRYPIAVNGGMLLSVLGLILTIIGLYRPLPAKGSDA